MAGSRPAGMERAGCWTARHITCSTVTAPSVSRSSPRPGCSSSTPASRLPGAARCSIRSCTSPRCPSQVCTCPIPTGCKARTRGAPHTAGRRRPVTSPSPGWPSPRSVRANESWTCCLAAPRSIARSSRRNTGVLMQLTFDSDVEEFRAEFAAFLDEHLPSEAETLERPRSVSHMPQWARDWQRLLFDNGWLLPAQPPEFGGRNATVLQQFVHLDELGRPRIYHSFNPQGVNIIAASLISFRSDDQKYRS